MLEIYSNQAFSERGGGVLFTAGASYNIGEVHFRLGRFNSPTGYLSAQLFSVSGGLPNTLLSESNKIDVSSSGPLPLYAAPDWVVFTMVTKYPIVSGTDYIIMCARPSGGDAYTGDGSNHPSIFGTGGNTSARSAIRRSNADAYTSAVGDDISFKIYDSPAGLINIGRMPLRGVQRGVGRF